MGLLHRSLDTVVAVEPGRLGPLVELEGVWPGPEPAHLRRPVGRKGEGGVPLQLELRE